TRRRDRGAAARCRRVGRGGARLPRPRGRAAHPRRRPGELRRRARARRSGRHREAARAPQEGEGPRARAGAPRAPGAVAPGARARFIRASYALLDLVSFLTSGEDECRAWPIRRGTTALKAAGKVHSDIERGFIRAEVIAYEDFVRLGSEARCREAGKLRLEGKDYVVQDGDIIHFRFAV